MERRRYLLVTMGCRELFAWRAGHPGETDVQYLKNMEAPFAEQIEAAEVLGQCFVQVRRPGETSGNLRGRSYIQVCLAETTLELPGELMSMWRISSDAAKRDRGAVWCLLLPGPRSDLGVT